MSALLILQLLVLLVLVQSSSFAMPIRSTTDTTTATGTATSDDHNHRRRHVLVMFESSPTTSTSLSDRIDDELQILHDSLADYARTLLGAGAAWRPDSVTFDRSTNGKYYACGLAFALVPCCVCTCERRCRAYKFAYLCAVLLFIFKFFAVLSNAQIRCGYARARAGLRDLWGQLNGARYTTIIYAMRDGAGRSVDSVAAAADDDDGGSGRPRVRHDDVCTMAHELTGWRPPKRVLFWPCRVGETAAAAAATAAAVPPGQWVIIR